MAATFWAALGGFALGSFQSLLLDWLRARSLHRRQLRLWRSELRRLSGYRRKFDWTATGPASDTVPNPPRVTASYQRLLQETDFWLTDEHRDDNTQQGLIDIADGAAVLDRYAADVHRLIDEMRASAQEQKKKYADRAMETSSAYDRELDRWQIMVNSGLMDIDRRLRIATVRHQLLRAVRPMPKGENPVSLPPISYDSK
jgi:hypothetical protein